MLMVVCSINHPIACANHLSSTGIIDIRAIQAAILHDTVEDTNTTIGQFDGNVSLRQLTPV